MPNSEDSAIIVKRQNFDTAMKSIKDFPTRQQNTNPWQRFHILRGFSIYLITK